jgi:DNA helicase-2/ATP-dependent DNA helicase PcrA
MTGIPHSAAIEMEAAVLGAEIVAFLMQPDTDGSHFDQFIRLLRNYYHGKGGGTPTIGDLKEAENISKAVDDWYTRRAAGKTIRQSSILVPLLAAYGEACLVLATGDPDSDWRAIRRALEMGPCPRLKQLALDVRNVRLLERGTQLRQALSQDWRDNGAYANALTITQQAFVQEHFSTNAKPEKGVVVMNMHKAKGKQFDEVIIFEGWPKVAMRKIVANPDRIVQSNDYENADDQARQNFRVSVTRGKLRTTILTPKGNPCVLLLGPRTE